MIQPFGYENTILVYCQLKNGRTIFFSKMNTTLEYFRDWTDYHDGFGAPSLVGHWLGNENVYQITKQGTYSMTILTSTIHVINAKWHPHFSQYSGFRLGSESEGFVI